MAATRIVRNLRLGLKSLLLHKLRSILTMLGVVFGVASVISMLAIGEGSKQEALQQIERLGTNNIIVKSQKPVSEEAANSAESNRRVESYGIRYEDAERIADTIPNVSRIVPIRSISETMSAGNQRVEVDVVGTTPALFELIHRDVIAGRVLALDDDLDLRPVIVLTETLARRILAKSHTIGAQVLLGKSVFTVVGILRSESRVGAAGSTLDEEMDAFIPIETARAVFGEILSDTSTGNFDAENVNLHKLVVQAADRDDVTQLASAVRYMFKRFHDVEDYKVSVPLELLRQAEDAQNIWNWTLGAIAGISLLVGGIGIMNIMLASVTERTREIGVRRAIGAGRAQIIAQFLIEATMLSMAGGVVGLILGAGVLPVLITQLSGIQTIVPMYSIVLSVGISVGVGIGFGLYPATRAADLDPIEALRH